jgi:hypothetical protein
MANYSLVIDSKFRPFEYQELLAPVLMATQAHQALEEAYGDLDTEASIWDRRTEGSERAHSLYTNFSKDLDSAAEALSKYGLTPQSRSTMLNMRSRYAKDITPIVEAWTKRQADIKAQQEAMLRDPYHAFNRVAADTSLDTYLDNPNIDVLSENASGAVLAAQVRAMAGDIKNYIDNKNIGKLKKLGLPYQYIQKIIKGATADQVLKTMQGDPEAAPFLHNIVDTVMKGSGVRDWSSMNGDWANNPIYKRLENQAMTGLTAAIGTTELRNYTDNFSLQDQLNARQHDRAVADQERRERDQARRNEGNIPLFFSKITSPNMDESLQKNKKLGARLQKFLDSAKKGKDGRYYVKIAVNRYTRQSGPESQKDPNFVPDLTVFKAQGWERNDPDNMRKEVFVPITDKNGKFISKNDFVTYAGKVLRSKGMNVSTAELGKALDTSSPATLGGYYRYTLGSIATLSNNKEVNMSNVKDVIKKSYTDSSPYTVNALEYRFGEAGSNNQKVLSNMLPRLSHGKDQTLIKKITSITPDGTITTDNKYTDLDTFKDSEGKIKDQPLFYRINTKKGSNDLIMKFGNESYLVPGGNLGNIFGESSIDVNRLAELYEKRQSLIDTYGEAAYWADPVSFTIEQSLNNLGAASVRKAVTAMGGGYKTPTYGITQSNQNNLE